jgi:membrane protease YdiL (CAAX protease family)
MVKHELSVQRTTFSPMKIFEDIATAVGFAVAALLSFYLIPEFFSGGNGDAMFEYAVMAFVAFYIIRALHMSTLRFFRLPEISVISGIGFVLAGIYCYMRVFTDDPVSLTFTEKVLGLIYLLLIGLGEELVARGFIFGVFDKYGTPVAVFVSSLVFALMHLNLYLGEYWNAQNAYYHVLHTFGFAVLAAAVMLATKSIWTVVLMHAVSDWGVVFSKNAPDGYIPPVEPWDPAWDVVVHSFNSVVFPITFALIIFVAMWLSKKQFNPKWLKPLLMRWKLVEVEEEVKD